MDWDKLRTFSAAAKEGSLTNAGNVLNLSQSAVSRQITALEEDLRTSLFHRHARGLKLTEQGETLLNAVREVSACLSKAEALLAEHNSVPRGSLKISTELAFGTFWLAPRLKEFNELYPDITVSLMLDGGDADLSMREADIAVRMSPPAKNDLVQRRIMSIQCYAYAAPDYLRLYGAPTHAADLDRHRLVALGADERRPEIDDAWLLKLGVAGDGTRRPIATLDNMGGLFQAVKSGLGIGSLPQFIEPEAAGLVRVLTDAAAPPREGYLVYPSELRGSKRVTVFRDFLLTELAEAGLRHDPFERRVRSLGIDGPPALPVRAEARIAHEVAYV